MWLIANDYSGHFRLDLTNFGGTIGADRDQTSTYL